MMVAYTLHLYRNGDPDLYCGSFHVPCPDGDPRVADLEAANCGRSLDENGVACRSFFFEDEVYEMADRARRETQCYVEISPEPPPPDDGSASLLHAASYRPPTDEALTSNSGWNQHIRDNERG